MPPLPFSLTVSVHEVEFSCTNRCHPQKICNLRHSAPCVIPRTEGMQCEVSELTQSRVLPQKTWSSRQKTQALEARCVMSHELNELARATPSGGSTRTQWSKLVDMWDIIYMWNIIHVCDTTDPCVCLCGT